MGQPFTALLASTVLGALPSAVIVTDEHGRVLFANARAVEILGASEDALTGTNVRDTFPCDHGDVRATTRVKRPTGEVVTLGYAARRVETEGHPVCAISFRDLSETLKLTDERDRLLQLAAVGEVMPTLLHEVRNPLSAVISTVEFLLQDAPPGASREALAAVMVEARRIGLALDGLGAVGRSLRSPQPNAIDLACQDMCALMAARASKAAIQLKWDLPDLPPLPLDPATMRAIVFNLLTNAMHACSPGDTIQLQLRLLRDELELTVVDTGVGMPADILARCTELFYTTKRHGSGIGLTQCKRAVEEAGGRMEIQSVHGVGTAVVVVVPVDELAPGSSAPPPPRGS